MNVSSLYVAKVQEYATARMELAISDCAERSQWFAILDELDSTGMSVTARKEEADRRTVGFKIEAMKMRARVDGLSAFVQLLDTHMRAGITEIEVG